MNLTVYLTEDCNLACRYCAVAVTPKGGAAMGEGALLEALAWFLKEAPGRERSVTFSGGEPLLAWEALRAGVAFLRRASPQAEISVQTNATLLSPEQAAVLREQGCRVMVSLDGLGATHDAGRPYAGGKKGSTREAALKRLKALDASTLEALYTVTPANVEGLSAGVEDAYARGFGRIHFMPEFYLPWSEAALEVLDAQLSRVADFRASLPAPFESEPFEAAKRAAHAGARGLGAAWWKVCDTLVLGPDASFYGCHPAVMDKAAAPKLRLGDARSGLDWDRRAAGIRRAGEALDRVRADYNNHLHCPMLFVHSAEARGEEPGPLLTNADRVAALFAKRLRPREAARG